jgi:hypothetical protein
MLAPFQERDGSVIDLRQRQIVSCGERRHWRLDHPK